MHNLVSNLKHAPTSQQNIPMRITSFLPYISYYRRISHPLQVILCVLFVKMKKTVRFPSGNSTVSL
ncbi:hypothetical protein HMPREF0372_00636 [Flavonifractor plautii ATCC 29863]|uniref:Uncharacterized protein n=1 Tax=Flavonifractor plautii ATCC 29863 TaxID=411475 RepID=G9YMB5_FLAPL|nr:hypothetical protein HMPREF0372_00636 [Flavonifractor plautii ATCC 29863]